MFSVSHWKCLCLHRPGATVGFFRRSPARMYVLVHFRYSFATNCSRILARANRGRRSWNPVASSMSPTMPTWAKPRWRTSALAAICFCRRPKTQAGEVSRVHPERSDRQSRPKAHLDVLRGAPEPHVRMSMRRFTRLTNGFSKKLENHAAMVALYSMYYNFGRVHQTLRVTPAMEAGIADHVWSIEEIVGLLK